MACNCGRMESKGLEVIGHAWERTDGVWLQYVIRRCLGCHGTLIERTVTVLEGLPICLHCLSQEVTVLDDGERMHIQCEGCGHGMREVASG